MQSSSHKAQAVRDQEIGMIMTNTCFKVLFRIKTSRAVEDRALKTAHALIVAPYLAM
jgi:hypothetical protein